MQDKHVPLAQAYLDQYLLDRGLTWESIRHLPADEVKKLLIDASTHLSLRLAELEDRARFMADVHGAAGAHPLH